MHLTNETVHVESGNIYKRFIQYHLKVSQPSHGDPFLTFTFHSSQLPKLIENIISSVNSQYHNPSIDFFRSCHFRLFVAELILLSIQSDSISSSSSLDNGKPFEISEDKKKTFKEEIDSLKKVISREESDAKSCFQKISSSIYVDVTSRYQDTHEENSIQTEIVSDDGTNGSSFSNLSKVSSKEIEFSMDCLDQGLTQLIDDCKSVLDKKYDFTTGNNKDMENMSSKSSPSNHKAKSSSNSDKSQKDDDVFSFSFKSHAKKSRPSTIVPPTNQTQVSNQSTPLLPKSNVDSSAGSCCTIL